jgi:hypothetical protein
MGLPYLDQAMRVWGHPMGLEVSMMDADVVSETNCIRQPFSTSDIGQNKATVLINRLNLFWGTSWSAIPNRFHAKSFERSQDRGFDLLIGCVDTRAARKTIEESFTKSLRGTSYWLDLGNNAASGQYVLGQPLNARNRRKANRLRTISEAKLQAANRQQPVAARASSRSGRRLRRTDRRPVSRNSPPLLLTLHFQQHFGFKQNAAQCVESLRRGILPELAFCRLKQSFGDRIQCPWV